MNQKVKFLISMIVMLTIPGLVFADDSYNTIQNVSTAMLNAIQWFGYAIAVGILIYMGIKYVMSGANEKAELKGTFSKYLIGIALIVMCTLIASAVAKIANTDGKNDAGGLVDTGFDLGGMKTGTTVQTPTTTAPKSVHSKLAVSGTDGANVEIRYKNGTKTTDPTLPYEISQYVDGKVPAGTEIQLVAEAESEHGKEFDCWAIVDDEGNILEVVSKERLLDYVMPEDNVNIQAIYKDHEVAEIPKDTEVGIGQVEGRGAAKVTIKEGTPVAVVASSNAGVESNYSVKFRNANKKVGVADSNTIEKNGESYSESDNGITGNVYTLDSSASSGTYMITVATNSGQTPQNLSITRYDKNGEATQLEVTMYYTKGENFTKYYDAGGNEVSSNDVGKNGPFAISYYNGREIELEIELDIDNYSYVVNADCL